MKTLAVVTMVFLPGTAVASVFSMPFFNWQDESVLLNVDNFWIYWAVTVPLTVVTLVAWTLWIRVVRPDGQRHRKEEEKEPVKAEPLFRRERGNTDLMDDTPAEKGSKNGDVQSQHGSGSSERKQSGSASVRRRIEHLVGKGKGNGDASSYV